MGETKTKVKAFKLPVENTIVHVRFVKRRIGMAAGVSEEHVISGGMLEGATRKFPAPMTRSGGIKNILTTEEKDFFENEIYSGENMSAYGKFWKDFYVILEKSGLRLDISEPTDYLKYKLLLGWGSIVAPSLKAYKASPLPTYQFYLEQEGEEGRMRSKELSVKKLAWKDFDKIENDAETLAAVIFLMGGKKVAGNANLAFLNSEVEKFVDEKPQQFSALINDDYFSTKVFAANAERAGIIIKTKDGYQTAEEMPVSAKGSSNSLDNVVKFLLDPVNNEIKELIQSRLDNTKE